MIYNETKETLLKQGFIKICPIDHKAIGNLMKRSFIDLKTAKRNIDQDDDCSYTYAYNAMLRSGLALMLSYGYRPEIRGKHLTIIKFTSSIMGSKFNNLINSYDLMRRKRHQFIYEPDLPCSSKEAHDALIIAKDFVDLIHKLIKEKDPQIEFEF